MEAQELTAVDAYLLILAAIIVFAAITWLAGVIQYMVTRKHPDQSIKLGRKYR